mgnify:CR=1 FL=1
MITALIRWSLHNRILVLLATALIVVAGLVALARTPVDAIPDLTDVQVIIQTSYPGQAPQVVEDQVTYPLTTNLQGLASVRVVRSQSAFGFSMINVIFEDAVDIYFARTRVLERLNLVGKSLPPGGPPPA